MQLATGPNEVGTSAPLLVKECTYTSCYCEENCVLLIQQLAKRGVPLPTLFCVFITNPTSRVPLWEQKSSQGGLVLWDYHVLVIEKDPHTTNTEALVYDLDTSLDFPCPLPLYAALALRQDSIQLSVDLRRLYRIVPAALLLQHFASDRRHMMLPDGSCQASPPLYPCLKGLGAESSHTLPRYLEVAWSGAVGDPSALTEALRKSIKCATSGQEVGDDEGQRYGIVATEEAMLDYFNHSRSSIGQQQH